MRASARRWAHGRPSAAGAWLLLAALASCSRSPGPHDLLQAQAPPASSARPAEPTSPAMPRAAQAGAGPTAGVPAPADSAAAAAESATVYRQRCALCHGARGLGDGVAAGNLRPAPRSFVDAQWQASTSDEAIRAIIVGGGGAVGRSMMMPPARDLAAKPELLQGLVAIVRSFARPATDVPARP